MQTTRHKTGATPRSFGRYTVLERLGVGGMAEVHRAKIRGAEGFEGVVALKRILPHLAEDEQFIRSFVREAKLASLLNHPNIVRIHELGVHDDTYFMSMEYVAGHTLLDVLKWSATSGPPPIDVALYLCNQLCDALHYAHTLTDEEGAPLGIVHRDLSPSNLMVDASGHLRVIDFGIARAAPPELHSESGLVKGKQGYMSPEALRARRVDARSDVFSTGVVLHELLTGQPLFGARSDYESMRRVIRAEVEPPSRRNVLVSTELDAVVLRALDVDPDKRWSSAAALGDALGSVIADYQMAPSARKVRDWVEKARSNGPVLVFERDITTSPVPTPPATSDQAPAEPPSDGASRPGEPHVEFADPPTNPAYRKRDEPRRPRRPSTAYVVFRTDKGDTRVRMLDSEDSEMFTPQSSLLDPKLRMKESVKPPRPPSRWPRRGTQPPSSSRAPARSTDELMEQLRIDPNRPRPDEEGGRRASTALLPAAEDERPSVVANIVIAIAALVLLAVVVAIITG